MRRVMSGGVWLVIAMFVLVGCFTQFAVRLDYGPDEPYHLEYIHILATEGRLPTWEESFEVQHPPSYHSIMAAAWRVLDVRQRPMSITMGPTALEKMTPQAVVGRRVLRGLTLMLGCIALLFMAATMTRLNVPPAWRAVLLAVVAASPMLQYISSVVNNEIISIVYSSLLCWFVVWMVTLRYYHSSNEERKAKTKQSAPNRYLSTRLALMAGALSGGCILVKQNTMFAVPIILWALLTQVEKPQRWKASGIFFLTALLVASPWPAFNWMRSGVLLPRILHPENQPSLDMIMANPSVVLAWIRTLFESAVLPDWSWLFLPRSFSTVISVLLLAALGFFLWRNKKETSNVLVRRLSAMSFAAALFLLIGIVQFTVFDDWRAHVGGRYLLNALPWMIVMLSLNIREVRRFLLPQDAASSADVAAPSAGEIETSKPPAGVYGGLMLWWMLCFLWWFLVLTYYSSPNFVS